MKLILLSGGSGKRLWPLSNDSRSKQFLKVLINNEGVLESMVQRVWRQLCDLGLKESTIIATSSSQIDTIQSQLGIDVPLVIEPKRRDTFPAVALAATYLYSVKEISLQEVITILPVDPYVNTDFFEEILQLEEIIKDSGADLALLGVNPTYPSEKYGYIVPLNENKNNYLTVSHFKEKPKKIEAEELMKEQALWNCGIFAFKLDYIIKLLIDKGIPIKYQELVDNYEKLEKISFDYAVVENASNIVVRPYEGEWKDLGTWDALTEVMPTNTIGKGIISEDSFNTHLVNELELPITVVGVDNCIIAASPDGILVSDKKKSQHIKSILDDFEGRPMYEERRWGWYKVLDYIKFDSGNEVMTKKIGLNAGKNLSYQKHFYRSEVWMIIKGVGEFALNDSMRTVRSGDVLTIPVGAAHGIKALTEMEIIEVQTGPQLIEEDIIRIFMDWHEVNNHCNQFTLKI